MSDTEDTQQQEDNTKPDNQEEQREQRAFSQDDVNRIVARERKKLEDDLRSRPTKEELEELKLQLRKIHDEKELAGKSELEKLTHAHQRELEKLTHKLTQIEEESKVRETEAATAKTQLDSYRIRTAFSGALSKAGVYAEAADDALDVLLGRIKDVEFKNDSILATYGDTMDESPEGIAKLFLEDKKHFATAKIGGAGTKAPTNAVRAGQNVADLSMDQLAEMAGDWPSA
jgi:hypothetical protein